MDQLIEQSKTAHYQQWPLLGFRRLCVIDNHLDETSGAPDITEQRKIFPERHLRMPNTIEPAATERDLNF